LIKKSNDLEQMNSFFLNREIKMMDLVDELNKLKEKEGNK